MELQLYENCKQCDQYKDRTLSQYMTSWSTEKIFNDLFPCGLPCLRTYHGSEMREGEKKKKKKINVLQYHHSSCTKQFLRS